MMAAPNTTYIPQTLGFDQRWVPVLQLLQQQQQAGYNPSAPTPDDSDINTFNNQNLPMWKRVGLQAPPISGPQQSYNTASNRPDAPQGTIANTGAPNTSNNPITQSQSEIVGAGERGRGIDGGGESRWLGAGVPLSLGAPTDEGPSPRHEGNFQAPSLTGPQNPLVQRQLALRQQILQQAMANIPRGFHFKLG